MKAAQGKQAQQLVSDGQGSGKKAQAGGGRAAAEGYYIMYSAIAYI